MAEATGAPLPSTRRRPGAFRRLLKKPTGVGSLAVLAVFVLLGLLEPLLVTHSPTYSSLEHVNAPVGTPGWPLGGDGTGHDIWAMLLASIDVSLASAAIGTGVAVIVGGIFGLIAGYVGKATDGIASYVFSLLMSLPALVILVVLTPITGGNFAITMVLLGLLLSAGIFRLVRNLVVGVRKELYIDAARVSGLSGRRIISRHVLYAVRGPIAIQAGFLAAICIGMQAGLAFIGIGSNIPSFGSMSNAAFGNMYSYPIQLVWPTVGLSLLTGSLILLANSYRDALSGAGTRATRRISAWRPAEAAQPVVSADGTMTSDTPAGHMESPVSVLLRIQNLSVAYKDENGAEKDVVSSVSLDVRAGEIVGLVGESGSGKTQTAFSVLGLLPGDASVRATELSLDGRSLIGADLRSLRGRHMAYIPQEPLSNLDPSFTIGSQLVEGLRPFMPAREAKQTILDLLGRVGIPDPKRTFRSYPHQMSGGMAQRALIVGAVAPRPKLLIADEPTTALDVTVQAEILDLLRELQSEYKMGVLLVTHNFGVVADLCDRVVVMRNGQVVETGVIRDIFHAPRHDYTKELINAILDEEAVRDDSTLPVDEGVT